MLLISLFLTFSSADSHLEEQLENKVCTHPSLMFNCCAVQLFEPERKVNPYTGGYMKDQQEFSGVLAAS